MEEISVIELLSKIEQDDNLEITCKKYWVAKLTALLPEKEDLPILAKILETNEFQNAHTNIRKAFRAKDFAGSKTLIPILKEQGWLIRIDEPELIIDAEKIKESFFKQAEEKKTVAKPQKEIDLHIEKLREDYLFLNKNEILDIQLTHFQNAIDAAIVHQFDRIIFIHGVGNGILQNQIHKIVSKHPKVQTFKDAQKEKFGYGATEVFLK